MNDMTVDMGIIMLAIITVSALKKVIKNKSFYPYLPFMVLLPMVIAYGIVSNVGTVMQTVSFIFEKLFYFASAAIAMYDTVLEKIENVVKNKRVTK